ncbi:hypothetical protein F5141DRAFT_1062232 [Pisolithus sp. B1]|nr:hypothetical protein F5141DRAFT_1062232 [Pisolithus sp. B1]
MTKDHGLRPKLECMVQEAEKLLTPDERERIRTEDTPNQQKGKGSDPKNWGALGISEDELDVDTQHAALDSWNTACRVANESDDTRPEMSKRKDHGELDQNNKSTHLHSSNEVRPSKQGSGKSSKKRDNKSPKRKKNKPTKEKAKAFQSMLSPIKNLVNRITCQDHKDRDCQKAPRMMEPAQQINPKSQIGVIFK